MDERDGSTNRSRRTPAVERAAAILRLLGAHPHQEFTVSQLASQLTISKATAHSLVTTLNDAGLVARSRRATYRLGLALVAIGQAAALADPVVDRARREMVAVATATATTVVVSAVEHGEILIVDTTGAPPTATPSRPGQRFPLAPPLGTVFLAWADEEQITSWLRAGIDGGGVDIARYRGELARIRSRGFAVGGEADATTRVSDMLVALSSEDDAGEVRDRLADTVDALRRGDHYFPDLRHDGPHAVNIIAVPIFGPGGKVALALTATGFDRPLRTSEIEQLAERLRQSAATATGRLDTT
ncbi:MAG: helix-turn-helix domain-containing protein [Ilumatobacteraceae bacterium]